MSTWDEYLITAWSEYNFYKDESNPYDNTYCCLSCDECDIFEDNLEYHICAPNTNSDTNPNPNTDTNIDAK